MNELLRKEKLGEGEEAEGGGGKDSKPWKGRWRVGWARSEQKRERREEGEAERSEVGLRGRQGSSRMRRGRGQTKPRRTRGGLRKV